MTALPRAVEVIVVGGGPAGSATAWSLARNGVETLVLDRARFPRAKACAEYLSPQATRILSETGALAALAGAPTAQLAGMRVHAHDGTTFEGRFSGIHGFRGFSSRGLAVRRELLDSALLARARAAGASVIEERAVPDVLRDHRGRVTGVVVRDGNATTEIRARIVIGADGLRSVVARRLGLARRLSWPSRFAFVSHFRGVRGIGDCGEMHVFRDGYCGLADVGGGITNVAIVVSARDVRDASGDAEAFFTRWLGRHGVLAQRLTDAERVSPVLATGPFGARARTAWAPGAALVGDAADFYDPFTGEGIYAALRGSELLAPYVFESLRAAEHRAHEPLAAYDRCRRHEFGGKWQVERLVALAVSNPSLLGRVARRLRDRRDLADLLVGVTGDFVPAREVLNFRFAFQLLAPSFAV